MKQIRMIDPRSAYRQPLELPKNADRKDKEKHRRQQRKQRQSQRSF